MTVLVVGAVLAVVLWRIGEELRRARTGAEIQHVLKTFAPAAADVQRDPRLLIAWYPIAQTSRKLFPDAFRALDDASGGAFPFTKALVEAAHAQCTAEWLAWERAHDADFAVRIAQVHDEIDRTSGPPSAFLRTRLAAVEQQKLEQYQQRYQEYVKTAKALAAFTS
jgi:hypothetical protein